MKPKTTIHPRDIRRDVYSVKVWDTSVDAYCHQHMTTNAETAQTLARNAQQEQRASGRPCLVKIVHPRHEIVTAFLAFGNSFR